MASRSGTRLYWPRRGGGMPAAPVGGSPGRVHVARRHRHEPIRARASPNVGGADAARLVHNSVELAEREPRKPPQPRPRFCAQSVGAPPAADRSGVRAPPPDSPPPLPRSPLAGNVAVVPNSIRSISASRYPGSSWEELRRKLRPESLKPLPDQIHSGSAILEDRNA